MIHQYAISIENISLSDCKKIKAIISQDRQIKAERYYKTDDKIRCLLGEAIIKYALKKDYNMNSNISWIFNTYGKPLLAENDKINFNISHSEDWVVAAVGSNNLGIDIEKIQPQTSYMYKYVFSLKEKIIAANMDTLQADEYFIQQWTAKEAYTKALGIGLNKSFSFIEIISNTVIIDNGIIVNNYHIIQSKLGQNYYYTLCIEGNNPEVSNINIISLNNIEKEFNL